MCNREIGLVMKNLFFGADLIVIQLWNNLNSGMLVLTKANATKEEDWRWN